MGGRCAHDAGLLAVSCAPSQAEQLVEVVQRAVEASGSPDGAAVVRRSPTLVLATWGAPRTDPAPAPTWILTTEVRHRDRAVGAEEVRRGLLESDAAWLQGLLPPFAAATVADDGTLVAGVDALGLRQLYLRRASGWSAVSTSVRALAALAPTSALDLTGVAVQSQLGWQLGHRTVVAGVEQLAAATLVRLCDGRVDLSAYGPPDPPRGADLDETVVQVRDLLRDYLAAFLRDHPDPVLQLTGGQDSRLLLSAIAPERRRGLRVMTLGAPDSADVRIARELAERYVMPHERLDLGAIDHLEPEEAWQRCVVAARGLELSADPVARAALDTAEDRAQEGPRISGLGGEVARGFYYLGSRGDRPVTARRAHRLADWRMLANEAVSEDALEPEFAAWARETALREVHRALAASGDRWFDATDRLYLEHRIQRWAGATETAVCSRISVTNPMLDARFVTAVRALAPADKRRSRFLARLQVALDPELADVPLDGRPAPRAYAEIGRVATAQRLRSTAGAARRKGVQRLTGRRRAPAGGPLLAARAAAHLAGRPELVQPLAEMRVFREEWLDGLVAGTVRPDPASTALLVNLAVAAEALPQHHAAVASPI